MMRQDSHLKAESAEIIALRDYLDAADKVRPLEQRRSHRLLSQDRLFVQITESPLEPAIVGMTTCCDAENLSGDGMAFIASRPLPVGTRLDLWLDIRSRTGKFFLSAEVMWSERIDDGSWRQGVRFVPGFGTDLSHWQAFQQTLRLA